MPARIFDGQQEEGVQDDEDGARVVDQGAGDGVQHAGGGQDCRQCIQEQGDDDVRLNLLQDVAGEGQQVRDAADVVLHKDHVGRFDGDIRPDTTHGDSGVGRAEGDRVVDAVADHTDPMARLLVFPDDPLLVLRQQSAADSGNAGLCGHMLRGGRIVAGQQD